MVNYSSLTSLIFSDRKSFQAKRTPRTRRLGIEHLEDRCLLAYSSLAYPGTDGRMLYRPDDQADHLPNFANVGYKGGMTALPEVGVKSTVAPGDGDDAARIQAAINRVSALPMDANGFRGAVLLKAGEYQIAGNISLRASGVVLRGEGDSAQGTVLRATGADQRTLVQILGGGNLSPVANSTYRIVDWYVPVGAISFRVSGTEGLSVGDKIVVHRPSPANWIHDINMDLLEDPWEAGSGDLDFERVVTRIEGNLVTIDSPLTNSIDQKYGGGTICEYAWPGRIQNVGVEHLLGCSDFVSNTDDNHSWRFISIDKAENAWVRDITTQFFAYAAVDIGRTAKLVTVDDSQCLTPVSSVDGGRRDSFHVNGQLNLVKNCYSNSARHDYSLGSSVAGPNVFVDDQAVGALNDTGPHQRWSSGALFDNVRVSGNQIDVQNRGNSGSGHGWAGANMVVWNCTADGGYVVQNPPTAQNWLIGSTGPLLQGTMYVGPRPSQAVTESQGKQVSTRSLYYAQLAEQMNQPALSRREYSMGGIDAMRRDPGTVDDPYVEPGWRSTVDAATVLPLNGFDVSRSGQSIPFSFDFDLGTDEQVVSASLSLGLRATGGGNLADRIYLDGLNTSYSFAQLGWQNMPATVTTGRVLDLTRNLAALQDGVLNVAVQQNTAVDWAVLNVQVAPKPRQTALATNFDAAPTAMPANHSDGVPAASKPASGTTSPLLPPQPTANQIKSQLSSSALVLQTVANPLNNSVPEVQVSPILFVAELEQPAGLIK